MTNNKKSFWTMLQDLTDLEDGLIEMDDKQIAEALGNLKNKIDDTQYWISRLDAEEVRLAGDIKRLQDKKKAVTNSKGRFKQYIADTMIANDTSEIYGAAWTVKTTSSESVTTTIEKPSMIHAINYPAYVSTQYTWDKKAIKAAIKDGSKVVSDIAKLETNVNVNFKAKGVSK